MIEEMEKMSLVNERLLIAQMSLLMDDDCNTQMAVEYCSAKLKNSEQRSIKAKKVFFHTEDSLTYPSLDHERVGNDCALSKFACFTSQW